MSRKPECTLMHIAICTSDLAHSLRFYTEGLGFELIRSIEGLAEPFDVLMEIPGLKIDVHQIKCGSTTVELVGVNTPVIGDKQRVPTNRLGFTHLTLAVDDLENAIARVEEFGGKAVQESRVSTPFGNIIFCTDPDGTRIELLGKPSA